MLSVEADSGLNSRTLRALSELKPKAGCLTDFTTQLSPYCYFMEKDGIEIKLNSSHNSDLLIELPGVFCRKTFQDSGLTQW